MAEYINIIVISSFTGSIFFSAFGNGVFGQAVVVVVIFRLAALFVAVRATLPRMRYDQLIMLTWKRYLPFSLSLLVVLLPLIGWVLSGG